MRSLVRVSEAEVTRSLAHGRRVSARPQTVGHPSILRMAIHDSGLNGRYRLRTSIFVTSRKLPPDHPEVSHSSVVARLSASLVCSDPACAGTSQSNARRRLRHELDRPPESRSSREPQPSSCRPDFLPRPWVGTVGVTVARTFRKALRKGGGEFRVLLSEAPSSPSVRLAWGNPHGRMWANASGSASPRFWQVFAPVKSGRPFPGHQCFRKALIYRPYFRKSPTWPARAPKVGHFPAQN